MTADSGDTPRCLSDPIAVIVEVVGRVEPLLDPVAIAAAADSTVTSRTGRRKLATTLEREPSLLTSGRTEGPPIVDRFIRDLRKHGATNVVVPCCASCGKPAKRMSAHDGNGLRICVTCYNRANGVFAPRECAICSRILIPRFYDRQGQPRCGRCPPDPGVDHVQVICNLVLAVNPTADRARLEGLVLGVLRQAAQRRQTAWDLQDRPELLTGAAAEGSQAVRRLTTALSEHGIDGVLPPRCPVCKNVRAVKCLREGAPCCLSCYQASRAVECVRCGVVQPIVSRTYDGDALCWKCVPNESVNLEVCSGCDRLSVIATHRGGVPVCHDCRQTPSATCSICGRFKPCTFADSSAPRCLNCCHRARAERCARCGKVYPVGGRDGDGNPLCGNCSTRKVPCCRCGRIRPPSGRVEDGPVCWTCIKTEPEYFRACIDCGTLARMYRFDRCHDCAAPIVLRAALAGPDGNIRGDLEPVRRALATSSPVTLLNWLARKRTVTMLRRLADGDGPVTHEVLDQLGRSGPVRYLRQVLIAHKVLPDRDRNLDYLERWFDDKLSEIGDVDERRALRGFLTWTHIRRLRVADSPVSPYSAASIRNEVTSAIKLLDWLRARRRGLHTCTQADVDEWCLQGGSMPHRARGFVVWCVERGYMNGVVLAPRQAAGSRVVFDDQDMRWRIVRRLLHDDTLATVDRVAGLLVLLYGQMVSRIVQLTVDDISESEGCVMLGLGKHPLAVPQPLDQLLLELVVTRKGKASLGHTDEHRWLFPGGLPGAALHPLAVSARLAKLGIPGRIGRNSALMENAATMPAAVLSDLLGLSVSGAVQWTYLAGARGNTYAADIVGRSAPGSHRGITNRD